MSLRPLVLAVHDRGGRALRRGSRLLAWRPADPALSPAASGRLRARSLRPTVERRVILAIVLMRIVAVLPSILFPPKKPAGRPVGRADSTGTWELYPARVVPPVCPTV